MNSDANENVSWEAEFKEISEIEATLDLNRELESLYFNFNVNPRTIKYFNSQNKCVNLPCVTVADGNHRLPLVSGNEDKLQLLNT